MRNKGFTLVEILIVVVILGILAAIVIPQFSDASTQSKVSSAASSVQTMRSQLSLYKIQHNDNLPTVALFEDAMTLCSDAEATDAADYEARTAGNTATHPYGPYLKSVPKNPFNNSDSIAAADAADVGWVYDAVTGEITVGVADITNGDLVDELQSKGVALPDAEG